MASGNYKWTFATTKWGYPDVMGILHYVSSGQVCTFAMTDLGTTAAFTINYGQSVNTTDGHKIYFRPMTDGSQVAKRLETLSDGTNVDLGGELVTACPLTGIEQRWKPASFTVDNADAPAACNATFEDQFGNVFYWSTIATTTTSS